LSDRVLKAIEYLLFPLVRLVIARSISFGSLSDLIKYVMVKEAEQQLKQKNTEVVSDSRISIVTGVHRREVKRIRSMEANDVSVYQPSLASQVVARWAGEKKLQSKNGPKRLPRKKPTDKEFDFDDLVTSIHTDVRPRVVLEELIDRGLVTMSDSDDLQLHPEKLAMKQDQEETLHYLGLNIHDHLATAVHNLSNPDNKQLDRCVHYHGLSKEAVERIRKIAEKHSMDSLVVINKIALELINDPRSQGDQRMNFGTYFHHEKIKKN
jgi:hypothetical protein